MTPHKIIHVLKGKANPNTMNGVNKVVHNLATTQIGLGHDVQVWGITATPGSVTHEHIYPLHLFTAKKNRFAVGLEMMAALNHLPRGTIFHLHSVFLPELYALSRQLKKRGFKWVISPHGGYALESRKKNRLLKTIYMALFERKLIKEAAAIHAIGTYGEADQFDENTRKTKVCVVPNGHTLSEQHKKNYAKDGPLHLSYCGRLARAHKGLDLLLEAISQAVREGVDVQLDLIGDGPDRENLESMTKSLGVINRVIFHGIKMGEEKEYLIMKSDVFVHTSRWEGIPTAVLEAAGLGLPLLITRPTNMGEYVSAANAGYVIDELSPESIARVIRSADVEKRSGALEGKGMLSRKMIEESFAWDGIVRLINKSVYSKAVVA